MRRARHIENKIDNLYESVGVSMGEINRILIRIDEGPSRSTKWSGTP